MPRTIALPAGRTGPSAWWSAFPFDRRVLRRCPRASTTHTVGRRCQCSAVGDVQAPPTFPNTPEARRQGPPKGSRMLPGRLPVFPSGRWRRMRGPAHKRRKPNTQADSAGYSPRTDGLWSLEWMCALSDVSRMAAPVAVWAPECRPPARGSSRGNPSGRHTTLRRRSSDSGFHSVKEFSPEFSRRVEGATGIAARQGDPGDSRGSMNLPLSMNSRNVRPSGTRADSDG